MMNPAKNKSMFDQVIESLAIALDRQGLAYMLIGGQAVLLHGEPRLTQDVDVTLDAGPERLDDLLRVVDRLGWQVLVADAQAFVQKHLVLPCLAKPLGIRVDFIFSFTPFEKQAIQRAEHVRIGQTEVYFATPEDLIIQKMFAGRPRDLEDVRSILAKNPVADQKYIKNWLEQFGELLDRPLVEQFEQIWGSLT